MSRWVIALSLVLLAACVHSRKWKKKKASPQKDLTDGKPEEVLEILDDSDDEKGELYYVQAGAAGGGNFGASGGGGIWTGGNMGGYNGGGVGGYGGVGATNEPVATDGGTDAAATTDASATDNYSTDIETGPTGTVPTTNPNPMLRGCWLQLPSSGQWVWNPKTYTNKCGGYVQLSNCKWQWTLHPERFSPVTCFNMHLVQPSGGGHDGNPGGGNFGDDDNDEGEGGYDDGNEDDTDGEDGGPGDVDEDGGDDGGEDGWEDVECDCGDWDFPGECGSDGLIFRWRMCEPRYCLVEDEYVEC